MQKIVVVSLVVLVLGFVRVAHAFVEPCAKSTRCSSVTQCDFEEPNDVSAYACFAFKAKYTCEKALEEAPQRLDDADEDMIVAYFQKRDADDKSCVPSALQRGALRTALWTGKKKGAIQHAVQLLPSVAIGIPIVNLSEDSDASRALADVGPIAGVTARYSPVGFWVSAHAFLGTAGVDSKRLDATVYPSPKFLIVGGGLDTLSGVVSFSLLYASLHPNSLFEGEGKSSATYLQIAFDLTAIGVLAAGVATE